MTRPRLQAAGLALTALHALAGGLTAQRPADPAEEAFGRLTADLERTAANGLRPPIERQRTLLEEFLGRHGESRHVVVLRARTLLANLLLHRLDAAAALVEFKTVAERASAEERDLKARAQYGVAQALEVQGEVAAARTQLTELARAHAGTRYADLATAALRRLSGAGPRVEVGKAAPRFGPLLDQKQQSIELRALHGAPVVLVFWSCESAASIRMLERIQTAWRQQHQPWTQMIAFALDADPQRLAATVREQRIEATVVPCVREAIDPVVLDYGVAALPAVFLLGSDGTLVARNPSMQTFAELLKKLVE